MVPLPSPKGGRKSLHSYRICRGLKAKPGFFRNGRDVIHSLRSRGACTSGMGIPKVGVLPNPPPFIHPTERARNPTWPLRQPHVPSQSSREMISRNFLPSSTVHTGAPVGFGVGVNIGPGLVDSNRAKAKARPLSNLPSRLIFAPAVQATMGLNQGFHPRVGLGVAGCSFEEMLSQPF